MPAVGEHFTAKNYVDRAFSNSLDEPTLVRKIQVNNFTDFSSTDINVTTLGAQAVHDNQVITK